MRCLVFFRRRFGPYKFAVEVLLIFALIFLNLRGVRESVLFLLPIFLLFIVMHLVVITLGIVPHAGRYAGSWWRTRTRKLSAMLRDWLAGDAGYSAPRLQLGRRHLYRNRSGQQRSANFARTPCRYRQKDHALHGHVTGAFTAGGILLCYLLNRVMHEPGKTLNASLFANIYGGFFGGDSTTTATLVIVTLITEAALLIVAAQAGFLDGPRVLSNMSLDSWAPHRLSHLSDRLVTRNGVWFMGIAALGFLAYTHGEVKLLVVMYSINVFLTFTLSQLGMCRHWWQVRRRAEPWRMKLAVNGLGLAFHQYDSVRHRGDEIPRRRLADDCRDSSFCLALPGGALALRSGAKGAQKASTTRFWEFRSSRI